jgi:hypothetical protein
LRNLYQLNAIRRRDLDVDGTLFDLRCLDLCIRKNLLDKPRGGFRLLVSAVSVSTEGEIELGRVHKPDSCRAKRTCQRRHALRREEANSRGQHDSIIWFLTMVDAKVPIPRSFHIVIFPVNRQLWLTLETVLAKFV